MPETCRVFYNRINLCN